MVAGEVDVHLIMASDDIRAVLGHDGVLVVYLAAISLQNQTFIHFNLEINGSYLLFGFLVILLNPMDEKIDKKHKMIPKKRNAGMNLRSHRDLRPTGIAAVEAKGDCVALLVHHAPAARVVEVQD